MSLLAPSSCPKNPVLPRSWNEYGCPESMALRYDTLFFTGATVISLALSVLFFVLAFVFRRIAVSPSRSKNAKSHFRRSKNACFILSSLMLGLFFFVLTGFDYIPYYVAGILSTVTFLGLWAFAFGFAHQVRASLHQDRKAAFALRRQLILQFMPLLTFCVFWFWLSWAVSRTCITFYPFSVSTTLSRSVTPDVCKLRDPCHLYLVVGTDLAHEVIVHFHSNHLYGNPLVVFGTSSLRSAKNNSDYPFAISARIQQVPHLETARFVYYAALSNLNASTAYYFRVVDNAPLSGYATVFSKEFQFVTAQESGSLSANFSFVTGGDMGVSPLTDSLTAVAASKRPLFAAIGGDMAYDNSIAACYRRWDAWLDLISKHFISATNAITPLIVAPGNHEGGNFFQTDKSLFSFYHIYFVRQPLPIDKLPRDMPSYSSHRIGSIPNHQSDLLLMSLDSSVYELASSQVTWINETMSSARLSARWLAAIYHAPMWPSVRPLSDAISTGLRDAWTASFDFFGLDVAFENHDHAYKRTKPIRNGAVATNGTLHVGDGNWGVADPLRKPQMRDYMDFVSSSGFVLLVNVTNDKIYGQAINENGVAIDNFSTEGYSFV